MALTRQYGPMPAIRDARVANREKHLRPPDAAAAHRERSQSRARQGYVELRTRSQQVFELDVPLQPVPYHFLKRVPSFGTHAGPLSVVQLQG